MSPSSKKTSATTTAPTTATTKAVHLSPDRIKRAFVGKNDLPRIFAASATFLGKVQTMVTSTADQWLRLAKQKQAKLSGGTAGGDSTPSARPSNSNQPKSPLLYKVVRILLFPIINPYLRYALLVLFLMGFIGLVYILRDLPSPRRLTSSENFAVSTQIFDRNGILLYEIFADENRIPVAVDDLPPHVLQATVAIEDQRFYSHFGFDVIGITRALRNNLQGKPIEGGSTITQQLVKNALLTSERFLAAL